MATALTQIASQGAAYASATKASLQAPVVASSLFVRGETLESINDAPTQDFSWTYPTGTAAQFSIQEDEGAVRDVPATDRTLAWYPSAGRHVLHVWSISRSGGRSAAGVFPFTVTDPGAPATPMLLEAEVTDPASPRLSGVVTSRDDTGVVVNFFLTDQAGQSVGAAPYASAEGESGRRFALQIPSDSLSAGGTYLWWMTACHLDKCSAPTSKQVLRPNRPESDGAVTLPPSGGAAGSANALALAGRELPFRQAVQQFLQARAELTSGELVDADAALQGASRSRMISSKLGGIAPRLVTVNRLAEEHLPTPIRKPSVSLADVAVTMAPSRSQVFVRATVTTSLASAGAGAPSSGSAGESDVFVFARAGGNQYELKYYYDTSAADDTLPGGNDAVINQPDSGPRRLAATNSAGGPTPVATAPDGWPVASATTMTVSPMAAPNTSGEVSWALAHFNDAWQYQANCTNFVSKALHYGGGYPFHGTWVWDSNAWWWESMIFGVQQTDSWINANAFATFLGNYTPGSWLPYYNSGYHMGDIVFYHFNWRAITPPGTMDHTMIITGQYWDGHMWQPEITQSDANYQDLTIGQSIANAQSEFGATPTIYVRHITG